MAFYVLSLWNIFCWNNSNAGSGAYALWLRTLKDSAGNLRFTGGKLQDYTAFNTWFRFNMVNFSKYFC